MVHDAKDLSSDQKAVIEGLLGRRVLESEEISVRALPKTALSPERRQELVAGLTRYFAEVDARRKPGSEAEADDILNEAIRSVRPGYRPHK